MAFSALRRFSAVFLVLSLSTPLALATTEALPALAPEMAPAQDAEASAIAAAARATSLSLTAPEAAPPIAPASTVSAAPPAAGPVEQARLQHARELLGKYYRGSIVRKGEGWGDLDKRVNRVVTQAMKKSSRKVRASVARAIMAEARRHELDPVFIAAVIKTESAFDPKARGTSGEIGLMQLMPDTAKWIAGLYGIRYKGKKTLLDPVQNIRLGAAYLDHLRGNFDNHGRLYLSAYNMGPGNVRHALKHKVWPKDYVQMVMKRYVALYADMGVEGRAMASSGKAVAAKPRAQARR